LNTTIVMPLAEQRGGAEVALRQVIEHSDGLGIRWCVVFLEDGPMVNEFRSSGAAVRVVQAGRLRQLPRAMASVRTLTRVLRAERATAAIGWMSKAQVYLAPAARVAGVPSVWCQHGMPSSRDPLERLATALPSRGVIVPSRAVERAQERLRPQRPVRVAHPGVDLERFDPDDMPSPADVRARLRLRTEGPIIGMVARLQRWKGVHVLVNALPKVIDRHSELICALVGGDHPLEPGYRVDLERAIAAQGLRDHVVLAGYQDDVPSWLQAMDVVVHAAENEPFGLILLEAMALGKPVIAAASGGPTEIIRDSVDGVLVPHGDHEALATALIALLADDDRRRSLGRAATARAASFSSRHYAESLARAVRELTGAE
jgi:glycosyltransferase involved in cell wall biosynthesis